MHTVPAWLPFALGSAFFAGLTAIFGKVGVTSINSNLATFIRTIVILAAIAVILSFRKEWNGVATLEPRTAGFLALSGIATGLSWLCYYRALQLGPASLAAPIDKLSVVFAIVLAVIFLGEGFNLKVAVGGLLIVAGSLVLALG